MTQAKAETPTIKCEACQGRGTVPSTDRVFSGDQIHYFAEDCPLCNGTGRENADVQARIHVEQGNSKR